MAAGPVIGSARKQGVTAVLKPLLVAIGLLLLLVPAASAQSFDCRKATTAYEKAICADPDLGKLDETLAIAWATAIGGLGKPAAEVMRVGQRQWLDYVQRDCTKTGEPPVAYSADERACLGADLYTRIRGLEQSRMLDGRRFFMAQSFSVTPTVGSEEWSKPATRMLSYPQIDGDEPLAADFNAFVRAEAEEVNKSAEADNAEDAAELDVSTALKLDDARERRISMRVEVDWYGHGAAHPNYTVTYRHYLTQEGRGLTTGDVFGGRDWHRHLTALVMAALEDQLGDDMWEDLEGDVAGWATDPDRWNFSDAGLIVQFQPYEVTAYALGAPTVTIPWEKLSGDLAPDAQALATY
jgi:uncharacterized protein YecT (DUF1311 family)